MKLDVVAETTIAGARETVADYVFDHRNDPIWIGGITESELQGEPPIREGSHVRRVASFLGKRIEYVNEVERLEPASLLEMRSVKSPVPDARDVRVRGCPERRSVARIRVQGDPGAMYRVAGPVMRRQVHRSISRDLATLKAILEAPDPTPREH